MKTDAEIWNEYADDMNQWRELGQDEKDDFHNLVKQIRREQYDATMDTVRREVDWIDFDNFCGLEFEDTQK